MGEFQLSGHDSLAFKTSAHDTAACRMRQYDSLAFRAKGICTNSLEQIVVTNPSGNQIQILDSYGRLVKKYSFSLPCNPRGVCVDQDDNIIVAVENGLAIFNSRLELQRLVESPERMARVCTMKNKIFALSYERRIIIFSNIDESGDPPKLLEKVYHQENTGLYCSII